MCQLNSDRLTCLIFDKGKHLNKTFNNAMTFKICTGAMFLVKFMEKSKFSGKCFQAYSLYLYCQYKTHNLDSLFNSYTYNN